MAAPERRRLGCATLAVALVLIAIFSRWIASYIIEIEWWKELGQLRTWMSMLYYGIAPVGAATLFAFAVLWVAHARALKFAGTGLGEHPSYTRVTTLLLLGVAWIIASMCIDTWTVVRYAGSRGLPAAATAWHDSIFSQPLSFYLFDHNPATAGVSYHIALVRANPYRTTGGFERGVAIAMGHLDAAS